MFAVTPIWFDGFASATVMFWKSARPGDTDTTAKLVRAAAKWLVPGLISTLFLLVSSSCWVG
ncbi:hypothetical protein SAMN05216410_3405 [Sanguibacter gelidistatuariae]|uniref:Uncharacterized protein n=1 Tax=Sanguibacter gelidistatuariae TaxID=1814289 RepID=A0A1G6VCV6_9MICO|nr:hypothetical protein SAMN05216410_3405 [Sanguibacter gelidistatuariae]